MAVHAANVRAGDANHSVLYRSLGHVLGFLHRFLDGVHRLVEVGDDALPHAARIGDAVSAIAQGVVIHFGDDNACLGATNVDDCKQVLCLTSHVYGCFLIFCATPVAFLSAASGFGSATALLWLLAAVAMSGFTITW